MRCVFLCFSLFLSFSLSPSLFSHFFFFFPHDFNDPLLIAFFFFFFFFFMERFLSVFLALALLATALSAAPRWTELSENYTFEQYKKHFGKIYSSPSENAKRQEIFENNLRTILAHNAQESPSYRMGVNHMTDWTVSELKSLLGYDKALGQFQVRERARKAAAGSLQYPEVSDAPASVDWRGKGILTAVKDQGFFLIFIVIDVILLLLIFVIIILIAIIIILLCYFTFPFFFIPHISFFKKDNVDLAGLSLLLRLSNLLGPLPLASCPLLPNNTSFLVSPTPTNAVEGKDFISLAPPP